MISHELQVIGIHIPRTGMTSVEKAICGKDWWKIDRDSKHLTAPQAKERYREWWDDYLKVAFVRNPFDRVVSMTKFKKDMDLQPDCSFLEFVQYLTKRQPFTYKDWLGQEMDFIGKLENMEEDWQRLNQLMDTSLDLPHTGRTPNRRPYRDYYNENSRRCVEQAYGEDLRRFHYQF